MPSTDEPTWRERRDRILREDAELKREVDEALREWDRLDADTLTLRQIQQS